jgi:bifunctional enzyme CysN/CysC
MVDQRTRSIVSPANSRSAPREVHWHRHAITREQRAGLKQQRPAVLWLTGLSGAGKSTLADRVEQRLSQLQRHTFVLDGDNIRHGLNRDLGFSDADRAENIRRIGEVTKLLTDAGLIVIAAFISPSRAERARLRQMLRPGEFFEIFVDTPLAQAEARDVKGLYAKARSGQLQNFTGIDSPYEAPEAPELRIDTTRLSLDEGAEAIVRLLGP